MEDDFLTDELCFIFHLGHPSCKLQLLALLRYAPFVQNDEKKDMKRTQVTGINRKPG